MPRGGCRLSQEAHRRRAERTGGKLSARISSWRRLLWAEGLASSSRERTSRSRSYWRIASRRRPKTAYRRMRAACASSLAGSSETVRWSTSMPFSYSSHFSWAAASSTSSARWSCRSSSRLPSSPLLGAVLRQELARVQLDGCPVRCGLPATAGRGRGILEGIDVHPEVLLRAQNQLFVLNFQVVGAVDGPRVRRAAWRAPRRLLEAALAFSSGQRRSVTRSRWRR